MTQALNTMLTQDRATFSTLLRTYAICPPSDPGFTAHVPVTMTNSSGVKVPRPNIATGAQAFDQRLSKSTSNSIPMMKIPKANGTVWADLNLFPLQTATRGAKGQEGGNTVYIDISRTALVTHVPIWFLPWLDPAALRITIPTVAGGKGGPNIFFTAAINGCSIFIQGTPDNPTITHCGGATNVSTLDEGAEFWEAVMDEFTASDREHNTDKGAFHTTSVDKRQYVAQPGYARMEGTRTIKSTARAERYKRQLQQRYATDQSFIIEDIDPWGCVLGRRDTAGNWKFYLQENATVSYIHMKRKSPPKEQRVAVPMKYREIFPGGAGHHTFRPPLPRLL